MFQNIDLLYRVIGGTITIHKRIWQNADVGKNKMQQRPRQTIYETFIKK